MRVFVTGATGFIGSAVVQELLAHGHEVTGLARSDKSAAAVSAAGASVFRGSLEDTAGLKEAASGADGVIHAGYIHDFSPTANPAAAAAVDGGAIAAFGDALAGSGKPLVAAAALPQAEPAGITTEDTAAPDNPHYPRVSEHAAVALTARDVRAAVVRLPFSVHGEGDYAFVPSFIAFARDKGVSAYVGDGANLWSAVHRLDAARLFRLALEEAPAGTLLNAVGDEGVPFRKIAEVIGQQLNVPVKAISAAEAPGHFPGAFAFFAQASQRASSARTQERFGWRPAQPGLIEDLHHGHYYTVRDYLMH